ncbi:hypothetical protein ACES2I_04975 [Bdellovibrio bacteriovorus]|uniref:hypothetical protein n=1 Tax=Bdellovibrio bacteriovorus TaxID=959 RepID=UPI0035A615FD
MLLKALVSSAILLFTCHGVSQTITPKVVDGDYRVELTIGDKVFIDQMTLQGKDKPMALQEFQGEFVGTMIVPGSFTSPITGSGYCTYEGPQCDLNFSIVANENGQSYKVNYTAKVDAQNYKKYQSDIGPLIITGIATLEDGSVLGEYTATKQ